MEDFDYSQFPPAIQEMATAVRRYENSRPGHSNSENARIDKYRMKIALWVCRHEHLEPNLENMVAILGPSFRTAVPYLEEVKKEMGMK